MAALASRKRLVGFARTLRDNGYRVGLAETRDALQVLTSPAAFRPTALKPAFRALFCATHSDWERFDEIFDAFWQGRDMRTRQVLTGAPSAGQAPAKKLAEAHVPQEALGLPDRVERRADGEGETHAEGRGRREGASHAEKLRSASAAAASICAAPFIATSRTAAHRSSSPSGAARSSRCASWFCSMPRAR
jgi:uncharacterized protein with von Willebrand factor type A (vWA) domain